MKKTIFLLTLCLLTGVSYAAVQQQVQYKVQHKVQEQVYGDWLFNGEFANQSFNGFNPDYQLTLGDKVRVQIWGGTSLDAIFEVDKQGNIFIPKVGPVMVSGVKNSELNQVVLSKVKQVFQNNVHIYATLESAQPVKVYVTGGVKQPGLYAGLSSDSILYFLDKAQGIHATSGSYMDIRLIRSGQVVQTFNLYEFLNQGAMAAHQVHDGDTLFVGARKSYVSVEGLVSKPVAVEFNSASASLSYIRQFVKPFPVVTHVRIYRNSGTEQFVDYYAIDAANQAELQSGDKVVFVSDQKQRSISVRVEGEHESEREYILPHGSTLESLIAQIELNNLSDLSGIQLFRKSVKARQRDMLQTSLQSLESSVLTARSSTQEAAALRAKEAELILQWVERAKNIEPRGQVILTNADVFKDIHLEQGDIIRIPSKSPLVLVHGEVVFPSAITHEEKSSVIDYINSAGGYTQSEDSTYVIVMHKNGQFEKYLADDTSKLKRAKIVGGDEIFILPKVDTKYLQFSKDITQIIYQIAVSAAVVLGL
ncbi:polysaccharide biosynthesis/export family protein [Catenovulum sediminis]|uniref:Polysaccharide biosynthesis/export family protein n=1 Tax=Catenovulum sediminis TaxID=1740262 RepID=A0ABV1RK59_9ALTE|nr:polysaccharide biosynthesis/export family protein [Catenovulum sediminis]